MKHIWILGASGYVGSALTRYLIDLQLDQTVITTVVHQNIPFKTLENTNLIVSDLSNLDPIWLHRFPPDVIFHCARMAGKTDAGRIRASITGEKANLRLRELLFKLENKPVVVYCSGTLMYGNSKDPVTEDAPIQPISYAKHYHRAELPWVNPARPGEDIRMSRPAWILGPDSWFYHFFYLPAIQNGKVPYYGDGRQLMSLLHVNDCGAMLYHTFKYGVKNEDYNLYTHPPISQKAFSQLVAKMLDCRVEEISTAQTIKRYGKTVAEALTSNIPCTTKHPDWHARYQPLHLNLESMIGEVIQHLDAKKHKARIRQTPA
ncbi:MAG: NAD(P)-dependent oxidoreductase [Cryomorphaceae bacterium]|nr:NAD(P)-dependent oxidoreductase [Cryomorphaceae bacterium]